MSYDVIVVGGGIGGLTIGALIAAREVDVALFERQSNVGGCAANVEHLGHSFDPTFGLFSGWEAGGVWERVFAELPVAAPQVTKLSPNFVVRLPDGTHVPVSSDRAALEQNVAKGFPDCADEAIRFLRATLDSGPDLGSLGNTTQNFHSFIDAQLSFLSQSTIDTGEPVRLTDTLKLATGDLWEIDGGAQSLADCLVDSFKKSGGRLRLNSPVLRLAYAGDGTPNGIDLLSGERVIATRAIVSNLTIWDTYGKLVGLRRTPPGISAQLREMSARGVYQIFMLIDEAAIASLPAPRMIFASTVQEGLAAHMMLNVASNEQSALTQKRSATLTAYTDVNEWFAFHEDASWHEELDQATLERIWDSLHAVAPEVASGAEILGTATPQTYYESVRRKMGMVGAPSPAPSDSSTHLDNLFLLGDTAGQGIGLAGLAGQAYRLARSLA